MTASGYSARRILALGLPLSGAMLLFRLMGAVDVAFVAPLGKTQLAAAALGELYNGIVWQFILQFLNPISVLVARALGANDHEAAGKAYRSGIVLALALAAPMWLVLTFSQPILGFVVAHSNDSDASLVPIAASYTSKFAWAAPFVLIDGCSRGLVSGFKRTHVMIVVMAIGNVVNVVGDWALIYGHLGMPALGVTGAAWSTTAVYATMSVCTFVYILKTETLRETAAISRVFVLDRATLAKLAKLGLPLALRVGLREVFQMIVGAMMLTFGTSVLAANQLAFSLLALATGIQNGLATGASIALSQLLGAKDVAGARVTLRRAYALAALIAAGIGVVMIVAGSPIASHYSDDPGVIANASRILTVFGFLHVAMAMTIIGTGAQMALLEMRFLAIVGVGAQYLIGLPLAWLLGIGLGWGPPFVWWGVIASELVIATAFFVNFQRRTASSAA